LAIPIITNDKPVAYIALGQYSSETPFGQIEEYFCKELGQLLSNFFSDQYKMTESVNTLSSKLQKS
jgi:hypothetical protein